MVDCEAANLQMTKRLRKPPRRAMSVKNSVAADVGNRDRPVDGEEDCDGVRGEDLPFPLTLVLGCINGGGGKCGIFGGSWIGTLFRMCGILFIMATTVLSNGEVLELEILNWIFFVVVSSFSVLFFFAYMSGFLQETTMYFGIFVRTIADFAILSATIFCLVLLGSEAEIQLDE